MTKRIFQICSLLFVMMALSACGSSRYFSVKEGTPPKPAMNQYKDIHLSWMPYDENDWVQYGYEKKKDWIDVTKTLNTDGIQKTLRDFMPDRKITADTESGMQMPENGGLYVKFKRFNSPVQDLQSWCEVDVDFIDINTKKTIYSASADIYKGRGGYSDYSFEGRLLTLTYYIDNFLLHQLK